MSFRTVCCKIEMLFGKIGRKNMYEKNSLSLKILYRFFGEDSVFYINGAQTLPAPLDAAGEAKLLAQLKSDDSREECQKPACRTESSPGGVYCQTL